MVSEQLDQAQRINCKILVQVPQLKYHLAFFFICQAARALLPSPVPGHFELEFHSFIFLTLGSSFYCLKKCIQI